MSYHILKGMCVETSIWYPIDDSNTDHNKESSTQDNIKPEIEAADAETLRKSELSAQVHDPDDPVAIETIQEDIYYSVNSKFTDSPKSQSQDVSNPKSPSTSSSIPTQTPTANPQIERHIPSYEQWRKQVLEKKKPAQANERKLRKRKPFQENSVDVAIGSEEEIEFVFPNLDSGVGSGKASNDGIQHPADPLGNGPDFKQIRVEEKDLIKAEYAKDPKDRFNHASVTCAASVVKASKDATSITAILNEGKDHYMLNKCSTKEKFFVVELCEEILVDSFVLGNYEFFSSTFKDFAVSVNRYPPRDDGWSILGHFQARNTRDAQVFKPSTPRLATYIRFDFLNHYGNEYYCPITLLRVYGATALEQLKQEEEEEKRVAEEEKRLADLEKARQEAVEEEDDEEPDEKDHDSDMDEKFNRTEDTGQTTPADSNQGDSAKSSMAEVHIEPIQHRTQDSVVHVDNKDREKSNHHEQVTEETHLNIGNNHVPLSPPSEHSTGEWDPISQDKDKPQTVEEELKSTHSQPEIPEMTLVAFEETADSTVYGVPDTLPPPVSTSPASIHDDGEWLNEDLGMITLSPKAKPTQVPKQSNSPKAPPGGVGTATNGGSPTSDTSSQPQQTSQESVYKNIVNRLKVLELNSSLSYQYLEEQSNIFNDILESSEQKINQLVSHLNEATRRLETLGRKYDQLAYSYKAHVEIDGEKRRQEFLNLSTQVHLLVSQAVFQRQLFVICVITIISIIAFIAITRSNTMHYAIQQSPLGAKLRAISGHKRSIRSADIASTVRIGSVEGLAQFDKSSLLLHREDDDIKLTPPISPISPLTPNPNCTENGMLEDHEVPIDDSSHPDFDTSRQDEDLIGVGQYPGEIRLTHAHSELTPSAHDTDSTGLKLVTKPQFDHFQISRTPFPTPKSSYGPGRPFLHPSHSSSSHQNIYQADYRPESPVFQGPSSVHDEEQLSDADVAYMSRDMNVGRIGFTNAGSIPISPAMRRLSTGYSNHIHHQTATTMSRPLSSLRMDSTASITAYDTKDTSDNSDTPRQSPEELNRGIQMSSELSIGSSDTKYKEFEEDIGFVSDSVLDSASENMTNSRDRLKSALENQSDWERESRPEEVGPYHETEEEDNHDSGKTSSRRNTIKGADNELATDLESAKDQACLSREQPIKSRRRSSHNVLKTLDSTLTLTKSQSTSATAGLSNIGLGLEGMNSESSRLLQENQEPAKDYPMNKEAISDESSTTELLNTGNPERRKKNRKPSLPDDQIVPRRRISYGRRESNGVESSEDISYEQGLDGDDERSPQVPRKSVY
ncbi:hypothetical protein BGZ76_004134 [Entomortierella beljakovae]|nr:hypothetical protein BGZ76_004134 [Entomortierella beljakovae]